MGTTGWVILGIIAAAVLLAIATYNGLVALRQRTQQSFADIDVQLRQRHDLVPNLVETVKGYAHPRAGDAGQCHQGAQRRGRRQGGPAAQAQAEGVLSAALGRLFALAEAYPDLKANENFMQLQKQLDDIENKIAAARRFFNNAAAEYNSQPRDRSRRCSSRAAGLPSADILRPRRGQASGVRRRAAAGEIPMTGAPNLRSDQPHVPILRPLFAYPEEPAEVGVPAGGVRRADACAAVLAAADLEALA